MSKSRRNDLRIVHDICFTLQTSLSHAFKSKLYISLSFLDIPTVSHLLLASSRTKPSRCKNRVNRAIEETHLHLPSRSSNLNALITPLCIPYKPTPGVQCSRNIHPLFTQRLVSKAFRCQRISRYRVKLNYLFYIGYFFYFL